MLSIGAYSKKYQFLEKERKKEERDRARKSTRERAQALSKQTTQRQRALEEKKRAMAVAEEERRKRALEDRRKAQQDATEKFKMAISRLRSVSKPQQSQNPSRNDVHVEYYLPNKPKPSSISSTSKKQRVPDGRSRSAEKVVVGRDVEITMRKGLQRRTPSLDDVLRSIRGQTSSRHTPADPDSKTVSVLHPQPLSRRSASDTDLTIPIYQASVQTLAASIKAASSSSQATTVEAESNPRGTDSRHQHTLSLPPTDKASKNGNVVFHPVVLRTPTSGATSWHDDVRIMSPEHPDSSSSLSDSLSDTGSSTALQDSLNSTLSGETRSPQHPADSGKRYRRKHSRERKKQEELCHEKRNTSILKSPPQPNVQELFHACPAKSTLRSHKVNYDSDSSSSNSDTPYPAHPKSRRQARQNEDRTRAIMAEVQLLQQLAENSTEPKIVGILKRPGNSSDTSKATTALSTACPSEMTSAVGSVTFEYSRGAVNEGSRVPKRVRFVDQTTSSSGGMRKDSPVLAVLDMSAQTHLWNKVIPNSCYPSNSAFSPKMKVSLSSKAAHASRKPPTTPPNGIVVHIPRATVVDTSPSHHPRSPLSKNESSQRSTRNHQEVVREKQVNSPHTSSIDGSEDHLSLSPDDGSSSAKRRGNSPPEAPVKSKIPLDKTPTDDDINELWDQIRTFFRGEERVTVPTQIYKFLPENQSSSDHSKEDQTTQPQLSRRLHGSPKHASPQGNQAGQKQLVHRQQNRPLRCQKDLHQPEQLWKRHHSHAPMHSRLHPNVQPSGREPDVSMASTGSSKRKAAATGLSREEQRLIQSIEKLNQRLTDHGITQDLDTDMEHSHSPKRHPSHPPHIPRTRGPSDLPTTRVRRHPKAVALAAAMNAQAMDSRTALRVPSHRHAYYDNP